MQLSYGDTIKVKEIAIKFAMCPGEITHITRIDSGRINATYKITVAGKDDTTSYMLQKVNTHVFHSVAEVMDNALLVTKYLRSKGLETLEFIPLKAEHGYLYYDFGDFYRMSKFIHAEVFQNVSRPEDMEMLGAAVGQFAVGLDGFDAGSLYDTIPNFHNTRDRYENFLLSAINNASSRVDKCSPEFIDVVGNKRIYGIIVDKLMSGEIPTRVTHNDTKINNVLFDRKLDKPRCLIDLDTVMPGSILFDIADAIRYGANTSSEDEPDTSKVELDLELVKSFLKGFNNSAPGLLTKEEVELIPISIKIITLELAMRFLTDYYDGDKYFAVNKEDDNLIRARVQFKLAREVDKHMKRIKQIVEEVMK